ncbi:hypothetical protein H5411_41900 [Amycolatopsis echigonensis]|uniref:Uncharacterized protein n=1 Tax=Amycolatopsis echigonensis TaxID=2576905 RepID=A0A8E1W7R1_9PSEU|nr:MULTISPECIES: hypothetical protein [Amycolatopsis]MBB2505661.1 hypothetical protein [Amycolatopsis echigonensis]
MTEPTWYEQAEGSRAHAARTSDLALRVHSDPTALLRRTVHRYGKRELANPSAQWLIPWCSVDDDYPERHDRDEVAATGFADAGWCGGCTGLDVR